MLDDAPALYEALTARDARFDGVFFVGVTSTGIYCRPICPARTPKAANCRFFPSPAVAEKAGFRPCLRCRPELAPGRAPVDDASRIAELLVQRLDEGALDEGGGLERLAAQFGWSSRQIRRIVRRELGVSPIELVLTRRLLLAKQLLTETALPVTEVAFASGFASLRRFNDAFLGRYGMPPARFRRAATEADGAVPASDALVLELAYRPPYDWDRLLDFLAPRALAGVERVTASAYARSVELGGRRGRIEVRHRPERRALAVELSRALAPALPALLGRLRHLFDLQARPDRIAAHLGEDSVLGASLALHPGLRVPGAFEGFELAVRAVLGQQVSVRAATTLAGRLVEAFGERLPASEPGPTHLTPSPQRLAAANPGELAALGILPARARTILALAREVASGRLRLEAGGDPAATIERLLALPGIGPWTAHYVALRALRWPDAFPKEDLVVRRRLGGLTAAGAEARSRAWSPWRSYATLHLWQGGEEDA